MRMACCLRYGKGEYPGREVVQIMEVTTRGRGRSPQIHSVCLNHKKDLQPGSPGTQKIIFFLFSGGLTISLVTVCLTDLRFLFFFISVLGEVVATGGDGPVLAVLGAEFQPFEVLTNSSSRVGWIGAVAGLREGEGDSALGGLVTVGRPRERRIRI